MEINGIKVNIDFLKKGHLWLKIEDKIFIHAGFDPNVALEKQNPHDLVWDRELFNKAWNKDLNEWQEQLGEYKDIFMGIQQQNCTAHYCR